MPHVNGTANGISHVSVPEHHSHAETGFLPINSHNDIQSVSGYSFAPSVADSADWSQYSETDSVYNGRTSPDPFDTSNILTPPTSSSRYYSTVPQQQQSQASPSREEHIQQQPYQEATSQERVKVPENIIREFDTLNISDSSSSGSSKQNDYSTEMKPLSPIHDKVVKPSMELLKKRDEAFSWLDDTIGITNTKKPDDQIKSVNNQNGRSLNNLGSRSSVCLNTLDSGDEVWNNFTDGPNVPCNSVSQRPVTFIKNNIPSSSLSQNPSPYNLPPPPIVTRSNSVNAVNVQNGRALPAYRPPPEPNHSSRVPYAHVPRANYEFSNGSQQNFDPVRSLTSAVPSASREEILFALQACKDMITAERSLKIDQLLK